jgi:hypothetical protein
MPPGLGSVMPSHRVRQQRQVSQKLRRNLRAARIWAQPMRTPWANDIWASRSSAAMPILPDPSGVAGVSVSAATAFTGAAERRRNRSPTEQDATVHNEKDRGRDRFAACCETDAPMRARIGRRGSWRARSAMPAARHGSGSGERAARWRTRREYVANHARKTPIARRR